MEKIKENFKKYSTVYIVILLLLVIVGISYAIFAVTNLSDENTINLGQISMSYTEPDNALVLENALPMGDAEGIAQSNYFEFKVMTHATTDADDSNGLTIPYEINLGEIEVDADKQALTKNQIKVYLTKVVSGSEEEVVGPILLSNLSESSTSDLNIYQARDTHRNAGSEITTTYRLRAWIDEAVDSSIFGSQIYQYKFRVNVNSVTSPIVLSNLASNWKDYTEDELNFLALYTLDTKELPENRIYNDITYTMISEIDVSEQQNGTVILGTYQDSANNKIAVIGQNGGVIAPLDSSYLFGVSSTITAMDSGSKLTFLDLSNLDTRQVVNMYGMFMGCNALLDLNLSSFNTDNVVDMGYMFMGCSSLSTLSLSTFNTSMVTNMYAMFGACYDLKILDLNNFNTSGLETMGHMFSDCRSLINLNLSSFNTSKVTSVFRLFFGTLSLQEVTVGCDWNLDNVSDKNSMFVGTGVSSVTQVC